MHENEFEKKVQQKMEELQFAPSDAVWKNVDKEINKKEKRRPVFWLFFFLGLMLLGGGIYFIENNRSDKVEKLSELKKVDKLKSESKVEKLDELKNEKGIEKLNEEKNETARTDERKVDKLSKLKEKKKVAKLNGLKNSDRKKNFQNEENANSISSRKGKSKSFDKTKKEIDVKENEVFENGSKNNDNDNIIGKSSAEEKIITKESKKNIQDSSNNKMSNALSENKKNIAAENKTVATDSLADKKIAKNNIKSKKSSVWRIGFHFDPGVSSIGSGLFKSASNLNAVNYPTGGPTGTPTGYSSPSKIEPGFSASVGISANKTISKRLFFSTGLNYHYYSTSISTGKFVDSGANVYSSYNNSSLTSQVNGYYVSGKNKYTNNYHFLELPLLLDWQINKGEKISFIWEVGVSVSYLINNNALHFDPVNGIYYKSSGLFNKTQLNTSTSLMASFHINKNELLVGPQIQYGITRLLKNSTGNTEHLFYVGIKFSFILNKK